MSNKKVLLVALMALTATALTVAFTSRAANVRSSVERRPTKPETVPVATVSTEDVPQVVVLEVTPSGFEPSETIAPKGKFLILLQNRTGRRDLEFWLARENEGPVAKSEPQKRDWNAQVQLAPGTYIIGETNHPEWQSIIRVTN